MESGNLPTNSSNDSKPRDLVDPLNQTARGRLQTRRSKLNDEIDKELRLRAGAENLFRATGNKRLKELVAVELSFFNSNIQLLKEELCELNSSVNIYQHANAIDSVPMVPLGLKETREVDFTVPIQDFIVEHFNDDGTKYTTSINQLMEFRQNIRTPQRSESGVIQLLTYYNHLSHLEKRFYVAGRNLGIYFHWYDSLTGVPYFQRAISFEKGCVLFNVGALYTQIACKQDRKVLSGMNAAIENFQKAAGAFQYLVTYFSDAPSMDMQPVTLLMLIKLMKAQSVECIYERMNLDGISPGLLNYVKIAKMAAKVSTTYTKAHDMISVEPVKQYVPFSWTSMMLGKSQFYKALAHYYIALALMEQDDSDDVGKLQELVKVLDITSSSPDFQDMATVLPFNSEKRKIQGKAHYRESVVLLEEALNTHDLCRQMRKIDLFQGVLRETYERALKKFENLEEEDDFTDLIKVPEIIPESQYNVEDIYPEFSNHAVTDLFQSLGPLNIFSANKLWTAPCLIHLTKNSQYGFGFSIRGDCPVKINSIEPGSPAAESGLKVGDYIVAIGKEDTKWSMHDEVVNLVHEAGESLALEVVTPMGENIPEESPFYERKRCKSVGCVYPTKISVANGNTTPRNKAQRHNSLNNIVNNNNGHDIDYDHSNNNISNTDNALTTLTATTNNNNNSSKDFSRSSKTRNRFSATWLFIRKNSSKVLNKFEKKTKDDLASR
ncbi:rhophilin-2-B isoform X1 [Octopus bimaculoides]|uniref:rhophilin-2-B isoform X1 n=1 Tax=Octopus bimaculoides TaxID=37653 RepID=UPI00071D67ED|nr:rhophilin-2-B isoform X1 [Octopus bimaculoides]|eukprot:XP_014783179.1 PREDICTED: rhophilin-2-B-like isoform X1 [Octopus bimaculoides]